MRVQTVPGYEGGLALGQRKVYLFSGVGPSSYSQTTGDVIVMPTGTYCDAPDQVAHTVSGTYTLRAYPSAVGTTRATWKFRWYTTSSGSEVSNGVDLSAEKVQFRVFGGEF